MLTDVALKNLKPREKAYKVTDRDGLCVQVSTGLPPETWSSLK